MPHKPSPSITRLILASLLGATLLTANAGDTPAVDAKIKDWFALAKTERVAVIGIGDSNQRFGGHGYSHYMPQALYKVFGCYGSGLSLYRQWKEKGEPEPPSAPEELASRLLSYWYIPAGQSASVSWKNGLLIVPADHPLDVKGNLRFHMKYGVFTGEAGNFKPTIRRDSVPWTVIESAAERIVPVGQTQKLASTTLDVPADAERDFPLQFMPSPVNTPIEGAFLAASASCENTDKQAGLSYQTLYAVGGQSLADMLGTFREQGPEKLGEYFAEIRNQLNGHKTCIVIIQSGLNDRNERQPSAGPAAGQDSSTGAGYADNLQGIMDVLQNAWTKAGGEVGSLFFVFMPSHTVSDPDDSRLLSYRQATRELAATLPNAGVINLEQLVPYQKMVDDKLFDGGRQTDSHLDRKGYETISQAIADKLQE